MLKRLLAAISVGVFAISTAAFAADSPFPSSPSEGALGDWNDRQVTYQGKAAKPRGVPTSQFEGALGSVATSNYGEPRFEGTASNPTSIPSSPSEGALR